MDHTPKGTIAFVSLGCPKNLVDSERMLGNLTQEGYALQAHADGADVVVVNTCGFIEASRQESLSVIREMLELKKQGRIGSVVVAGCLAEREGERLLQELPGVDASVGVFGRDQIASAVKRAAADRHEQQWLYRPAQVRDWDDTARLRITPRHYAYLKISEGCDRLCTFCSIPSMRGKHVSKPIDKILAEAAELAGDGVRELNIVAQDSTYYGLDLYGKPRLAELLLRLQDVAGIEWVRVLYAYPMYIDDALMGVFADDNKVLPYLDLPLQHINDRVLKRMSRRVTRAETEQLIRRLRTRIPNLVLRTTMIVGFPGETEGEFQELLEFVHEARFERLGVFAYSFEPNTPSARLDGQLPNKVKDRRRDVLMQAQQEIAFSWAQQQVGKTFEVLIDAPDPEIPNHFIGRTYADAPDVDCLVRVKGKHLQPGDLAEVKITAADGYDLIGRSLGSVR